MGEGIPSEACNRGLGWLSISLIVGGAYLGKPAGL